MGRNGESICGESDADEGEEDKDRDGEDREVEAHEDKEATVAEEEEDGNVPRVMGEGSDSPVALVTAATVDNTDGQARRSMSE